MNLRRLGDRVVVKPVEREEKTKSGIVLPDTAKEKPQEGIVEAVGTGRILDNGTKIPMELKVGDKILYAKYAGNEFKLDEIEYLIVSEKDVLAVVSSNGKKKKQGKRGTHMAKTVTFDVEARQHLKKGIDTVAQAVRITLGPKGRNVVLEKKFGAPTVTNDGVTIVREIELKDAMENTGAQLLREVATKTNDVAGDGTTTATILAQTMISEGFRNVASGANPIQVKLGIEKAVEAVVAEIKRMSVPVKDHADIAHIATISSQDGTIGELIADAMDKVGKDGAITVEDNQTMATDLEVADGMPPDRGSPSTH